MPINKDFKRLVRARMEKTGEAYTTARAHLLKRNGSSAATVLSRVSELAPTTPTATPTSSSAATPPPVPIDYAKRAGMSDVAIKRATGCTWERWVAALDYAGAQKWSHRAIADYVHTQYKVKAWWTQTVTVGYERIKGLRAIGQRRAGGYEATKSKTLAASPAAVYRAFADGRQRRKWLEDAKLTIRKGTPNRSVRITWDDNTSVEVWLTQKGAGKTSAQVQHRNLADRADADRRRAYWREKLDLLKTLVET